MSDERWENALKSVAYVMSNLAKIYQYHVIINPIADKFELNYSINGGYLYCSMTVDSIKEIVPVLRAFGRAGFKQNGKRVESPQNKSIAYTLKKDMCELDFQVVLKGTVCRYVQVGVKEVPVMELQCTTENTDNKQEDSTEQTQQESSNPENVKFVNKTVVLI